MHGYQPTFTHTQTLYLTAKATFVVITFPVTLVFRSIKQVFASIVGYGVHTGVFMLGTYHSPMQKRIVEWIKQSSLNNPRGQAFDLNRLKKSFTLLENLGGHRTQLHPFDGGAKLEAIYFSREKIKEQIEEHGGKWETQDGKELITCKNPEDPKWTTFFAEVLSKMGWKEMPYHSKKNRI